MNRESELYLVFEAEFVPDQLEFFLAIVLASWVESYRSFVSYCSTIWDLLVNLIRIGTCHFRSISCSTISDLLVNYLRIGTCHLINQLQLLLTTCPDAARDLCRPHVPFVRCDKGCQQLQIHYLTMSLICVMLLMYLYLLLT